MFCIHVVISFTPCTVTVVTMTSELQSRKDYVITILGSGPLMVIPNVPDGTLAEVGLPRLRLEYLLFNLTSDKNWFLVRQFSNTIILGWILRCTNPTKHN